MKKLLHKKSVFLLLAFIGLSNSQLNAQETYTNASTDGLWGTLANWVNTSDGITASTVLPVSGDRATLKTTSSIDLGGVTRTVGSLYFNQNEHTSATNGTLVVDGSADDYTIANWTSRNSTVDCNVTVSVDNKQFRNRNASQSKLIFNGTVALGTNNVLIDNRKDTNPIEFNGTVTGSGNFILSDAAHSDGIGGISLGAASDFSGFSGDFITLKNPIISYTTTAFSNDVSLDGTGSFQVDVANTFTGTISRSATNAGAAEVKFNANQTGMGTLTVDTNALAIDFDAAATDVRFTSIGAMTGVVDLKNYVSGSLRIGATATTVSQSILDTWTLDGVEPADGTITQDASGNINFTSCTDAVEVTALSVSAETATTLTLGWTNSACFDEVLVVAKSSSAVTNTPSGDGSAYTANAAFGSGTDLGSNEYAVYEGTSTSVTVTGLTNNVDYHFSVFTRKGSDWSTAVTVNEIPNTFTSITSAANADLVWTATTSWTESVAPSVATDNVIIRGHFLLNAADIVVNNVTFVDDGTERIEIDPGFSLTANDVTLIAGSNIILNSNDTSFSSLIATSINTDQNVIYDRWLNDSPNNDLISSPVGGVTFGPLSTNSQNENRFFINSEDATNYFFGPFNNVTGLYETYFTDTNAATTIDTAKGYRAATINGAANTVRFSGTVLAAATDIDITDGGASGSEWNLIGNPYPSYLNFGTFFTTNSGEFHLDNVAVYGWNGTDYTVWNGANSSDKLAPGQGFFVRTKDGVTGNVDFTTAMRTTGNSNDFVAKSTNNKALAKINLSSSAKTYSTSIYFIENQTRGLDFGFDAGAFSGIETGIYTNLVEENKGLALAIQSLSYDDFNDVIVPVTINSEAGKELTISLDVASLTLPDNTNVYFKDNLLNTTTLLNDTNYVFTPDSKLSDSGRFFIHFSSNALSTDNIALNEVLIYTSQSSKTIIINGVLKTETVAKIFDIQGRIVLEQKLDNSSVSNIVDANALNTGIYIVQLGNKTQKVIIN